MVKSPVSNRTHFRAPPCRLVSSWFHVASALQTALQGVHRFQLRELLGVCSSGPLLDDVLNLGYHKLWPWKQLFSWKGTIVGWAISASIIYAIVFVFDFLFGFTIIQETFGLTPPCWDTKKTAFLAQRLMLWLRPKHLKKTYKRYRGW